MNYTLNVCLFHVIILVVINRMDYGESALINLNTVEKNNIIIYIGKYACVD